jgi:uncharacterized tellurite resistance protein B-like protein
MNETINDTPEQDQWTSTHDLALIFLALAYGTDFTLNTHEIRTITRLICAWDPKLSEDQAKEIAMEAVVAFMSEASSEEVVRSIAALRELLPTEERRRALEQVVRLAECDGRILGSERSLIDILAETWSVKDTARKLLDETSASLDGNDVPWSLLHDLALLYIVMGHAMDNDLSTKEIDVMLARLNEWQPDLEGDDIREILREALQVYAGGPDEETLGRSVKAIRDAMPVVQRLAILNDMAQIAAADGEVNRHETELLQTLSVAWNVGVRFVNPREVDAIDGEAE